MLVTLSIGTINGQIVHQEGEMSSQRGLENESAKRALDRATDCRIFDFGCGIHLFIFCSLRHRQTLNII